jgi:hypothetical protein
MRCGPCNDEHSVREVVIQEKEMAHMSWPATIRPSAETRSYWVGGLVYTTDKRSFFLTADHIRKPAIYFPKGVECIAGDRVCLTSVDNDDDNRDLR